MAEAKTEKKQVKTSTAVPITDILYRTLHYWPWVLLSVVVCVGIGVYYLLKTPKMYSQTASILIKENGKGKSSGSQSDFGNFGLFANKTNIENEMTTFRSRGLMKEVVKRMNLDMNYYLPGTFHKVVAYGTTLPVEVVMPEIADQSSVVFQLDVNKDGNVKISDMKYEGKEYADKTYDGAFNDTISTPAGKVVVKPSAYYKEGKTVDLQVRKLPFDATVASYVGRLTVDMDNENSTVINLTFVDQNIQRADDVLATVIGVYNESW
ncbi:MAG: chromosome partitioning protein ParA, partial [Muribaculaceae bacterium]|nr:chromosome partitioning protein ParA [Muribaculaceae bacterium]